MAISLGNPEGQTSVKHLQGMSLICCTVLLVRLQHLELRNGLLLVVFTGLHSNRGLPLEQKSLHTTFIVGELILQLHSHQLLNFNCRGINLCNACVSPVSVCLASIISQKGNHTTIMLGELISNYMHTGYTTIIVGELIV